MTVDAGAEPVEEVDEHGRVLRIVRRDEMRRLHLRHRTVGIAVLDRAGARLLVHQRAAWKDVWPSRWDVAFGGVVGVGEDWAVAAARELAEEAGVAAPLEPLGSGTYADGEVAEVTELFLARSDGPFTFPDGEVVATEWIALADLDRWLDGRPLCPDSVALMVPRLPGRPPPDPSTSDPFGA